MSYRVRRVGLALGAVPLSTFADGGGAVDITAIENISLGFSGAHGAGDICIDEIGFQ